MSSVLLCLALTPPPTLGHSSYWKIEYEKELGRVLGFVLRLMVGAISVNQRAIRFHLKVSSIRK